MAEATPASGAATRGTLTWLLRGMHIGWGRASVITLLAVASTIAAVCAPLLYAAITDVIVDGLTTGGPMASRLWVLLAASVCLYLLVFACGLGQGRLLNTAVVRSASALRSAVQHKLHRLPVGYLDSVPRGELLSKITAHTENATTVLGPVLITVPTNVLMILATTALLFTLSPLLALVALAATPVSAVLAAVVARRARPHLMTQWTVTAALTGCVEEQLSARRMITSNNAEDLVRRRFDALNDRLRDSVRSAQWAGGVLTPLITFVNALLFLVLAALGGIAVVDGGLTLGAAQAVILLSMQLSSALRALAGFYPRIQSATVSASKVRELLEEAPEDAHGVAAPVHLPRHSRPPAIVFDDVDFGYTPDHQVLHSVSFTVEPATTTAIVGSTGSGKTTLTRLLLGFDAPTSGTVLVDGEDITTVSRPRLRAPMAVVPQEPWLFTGTVRENIAYGVHGTPGIHHDLAFDDLAVDDQVNEGIQAGAGTAHIIAALPDGLHTTVGDDAANLSLGEKQLVTVARAVAARPSILILDEATSAADPHTELAIARSLRRLRDHTTTLLVTHRLATAARADQIVVLEAGRVVEVGSHTELLRHGGYYARRHDAATAADTRSTAASSRPARRSPAASPQR